MRSHSQACWVPKRVPERVLAVGAGAAGSSLRLEVPTDFVLRRDACSYGYFLLAPNHWDPAREALTTRLTVGGEPVTVEVTQPGPAGGRQPLHRRGAGVALRIACSRRLCRAEQGLVKTMLTRMLRLDESAGAIAAFHRVDPRFRASGRGRLFRSATLFEDVIKTVTSCNVQWPSTVVMNDRLCAVVGRGGAFPTAAKLKRTRVSTLRARCRLGYRDQRVVQLADLFEQGAIDEARLVDPKRSDDEVALELQALPGIGPYAAANIMQLLGRYGRLPVDTESVRHARTVLGMEGEPAALMRRVHAHYEPFGEHAFRSYWFELWEFYESRRGPSWTWDRDTTGRTFTASQL